jgi:hypothetical protein
MHEFYAAIGEAAVFLIVGLVGLIGMFSLILCYDYVGKIRSLRKYKHNPEVQDAYKAACRAWFRDEDFRAACFELEDRAAGRQRHARPLG